MRKKVILRLALVVLVIFLYKFTTLHRSTPAKQVNLNFNPEQPVVSFRPGGRLGNQICMCAHLLHTNITYTMQGFLYPNMRDLLMKLFERAPLPTIPSAIMEQMNNHSVDYFTALEDFKTNKRHENFTLLTGMPCRLSTFWNMMPLIREKFALKSSLKNSARRRLQESLLENRRNNGRPERTADVETVVGVHVRRGDFQYILDKYSGNSFLPPAYYHSAFEYFRTRFRRVLFLVMTAKKEVPWCKENLASGFSDVVVLDDNASAELDFVQLASLEHIIYSHGTFGLWTILLSNAKTVVYPHPSTDVGFKRYSHHRSLDFMKTKLNTTSFVTVVF
ncbi:galactoside alpha-(1,2)-fucosyltransferase 1 [Hyalella azteca]|uniref:L-Fucosyltransferase n=1 Tax=Hyalella azteca TaxID=294128 RepID=A0A979FQ19_HYAAZ|nr:galactoside alpha-(1,2)-fucosyltransferase 1 [Hyalella azteca]